MNRIPARIAALCLAGLALAPATSAQTMNHSQMNHGQMNHDQMMTHGGHGGMADPGLTEPGQGAFAAISEIVARLMADPETDWSKVNIDALRAHLVDMDMLVTYAAPEMREIEGGAEFTIPLTGQAAGAVRRMVPAHAPVLAAETGWTSEARIEGDRAVWRVSSPGEADKIRALGFFGLMATGDHHRAHHWMMATGHPPH